MSAAKHTPGPWEAVFTAKSKADPLQFSIIHAKQPCYEGNKTLDIASVWNRGGNEKANSNARLIAAAPELLEALCALVLNVDAGGATLGALADARAAIAKATGSTS